MRKLEFAALRKRTDLEAACHAVFHDSLHIMNERGRGALSEGQLTVICVETFFGEVCNGGLYQYLANQSPTAGACAESLRRAGLAGFAEIIERTLELSTNTPTLDEFGEPEDEFDIEFESDGDSPLTELESKFDELYSADEEEFRRCLFRYIVDHEAEFVGRPRPSAKRAGKSGASNAKPLVSKEEKRIANQQIQLEYNRKCRDLHERMEREGLPCPHCGVHAQDFRFLPGNEDRKAYFICRKCSRSFTLSDLKS